MDSRIVISFGRNEVFLQSDGTIKDVYLSRGFLVTVMYLHRALLHRSQCDWWLVDIMGLLPYDSPLPALFVIQRRLDCVLSILP